MSVVYVGIVRVGVFFLPQISYGGMPYVGKSARMATDLGYMSRCVHGLLAVGQFAVA